MRLCTYILSIINSFKSNVFSEEKEHLLILENVYELTINIIKKKKNYKIQWM